MRSFLVLALILLPWSVSLSDDLNSRVRKVDFADDVQPILRRNCYRCHGSKNQEAELQLNLRAAAFVSDDEPIIIKHDAKSSLLIKRLIDEDYGDLMPLDGDRLSKSEVDTLRRWVDEGANWPDELAQAEHWSYQPIVRPQVPDIASAATELDAFVLRRLYKRDLQMSPAADRARLLRRVSLALTGIPPSPADVTQFINDKSDNAYEKVVDRLLKSQRYGERWAVPWLDLARYADSNGFQADQIRDNWAYRDWVIRAFNDDLPFNDFVIDQIAGDLRPDATTEQKIATGFHRMTTCNVEAGVHPEANRTNQIVDRVNTTATVFMGTTLECAQCHDHKYDPFTQKDYYQIFAYFNNTPLEVKKTSGVTWDFYGPTMDLPMGSAKQEIFQTLNDQVAALESTRKNIAESSDADFEPWLASLRQKVGETSNWEPVKPKSFETNGGEDFEILDDGAVLLSGSVPDTVEHAFTFELESANVTAIKIDLLTDASIPGKGPGRGDAKRSNVIVNEVTCEVRDEDGWNEITLRDARADFSQTGWSVERAIDGDRKTGWAISPEFAKPHWATFVLANPVALTSGKPLRITLGQYFGRGRVAGKPRVSIFTGDPQQLGLNETIRELAAKKKLSPRDRKTLRAEFDQSNPKLKDLDRELAAAKKKIKALKPDTTLVMVEMDKPRETFVLVRGEYENRAELVKPGFPAVLPQADEVPRTGNRMELALWLTSPANPLLARVSVNRWWAELFGTGIVSTPEDFGTQAEDPSHPDLLDWLAVELIESGWSMKHVHKQIVMSATFQQDARLTPELLQADPNNRLYARGPRFRMPAETIRDNALSISGLLSTKMFGPPIMPFQPDDIWRSVGRNQPKWIAANNEDRFRRGVYVVCKRAAPYPSFINFDAPDRGSCTVNRTRTNTPLQALTLLNDPAYAEMALAMADRVLSESPSESDEVRLAYAIELAVARPATAHEIGLLQSLLVRERKVVKSDQGIVNSRTNVPFAAMQLRTKDKTELAAWFAVTNALLNLDETMSQ